MSDLYIFSLAAAEMSKTYCVSYTFEAEGSWSRFLQLLARISRMFVWLSGMMPESQS